MAVPLRILMLEDSEDDAELVRRELGTAWPGSTHRRVDTLADFVQAIDQAQWDIVIADYTVPGFGAPRALELLRARDPDLPFIVVSGSVGEDFVVKLMKAGANDYVMKGDLRRLVPAVRRELRDADERRGRRVAEERVRRMAFHDALTGLPNRNLMEENLARDIELAVATGEPITVLALDLDYFDDIVQTFGHEAGDRLVVAIAERLVAAEGGVRRVARISSDVFAVSCVGLRGAAAAEWASALIGHLQCTMPVGDLSVFLNPRVGLATCPEHGTDPGTLLRRARMALSRARGLGEALAWFDPEADAASPRRLAMAANLRRALEDDGQLFLAYQPRVRLHGRDLCGVEALVRWRQPDGSLLHPDAFISLAENSGLIHPLTRRVLQVAARQASEWRALGKNFPIGVNLSARSLIDLDLPEQVAALLDNYRLPPEALEIELTESVLIADPAAARRAVTRLSDMGLRIHIDDFGTGYSSLGYLKNLPVHSLKIDKSFVTGGLRDASDLAIVRSTIRLAHNLGLGVIAEGVEDGATLSILTMLGCDEGQGFHIAAPMFAEEMTPWTASVQVPGDGHQPEI